MKRAQLGWSVKLEKSPKATLRGRTKPAKGRVRKARGSQDWPCPAHYCEATWATSPVVPSEQGVSIWGYCSVCGWGAAGDGEDCPSTMLNWHPLLGHHGLLNSAKQFFNPLILLPMRIDFFPTVTSLQIQ